MKLLLQNGFELDMAFWYWVAVRVRIGTELHCELLRITLGMYY